MDTQMAGKALLLGVCEGIFQSRLIVRSVSWWTEWGKSILDSGGDIEQRKGEYVLLLSRLLLF
jgi:hypothetical protein